MIDQELKNLCLVELDKLLSMNGKSLKKFDGMPQPNHSDVFQFENRMLADEMNYDRDEQAELHHLLMNSLTAEQKSVYDEIMNVVTLDSGEFFSYMDMEEPGRHSFGKLFLQLSDHKV